jgi:hypothetical protein
VLGTPGFLIGYRGGNVTVGLGGSFTRAAVSATAMGATAPDKLSLTLFQLMPSLAYDLWRSADGRTRFDLAAAAGYGHATVSTSSGTDTNEITVGFVPFRVGAGADYFLGRNFALGGEVGFQSRILTSAQVSGMNQDISVSDSAGYGAIRLTLIVGG